MTIRTVTYEKISQIWAEYLWVDRKSPIESHSAMLLSLEYTLENFNFPATYLGAFVDDQLVGVNSGHRCSDHTYRSRGLYVFPEYRNMKIGKKLLLATIEQAKQEQCYLIWSYPRRSSWKVYESVGFELISEWEPGEIEENAYCKLEITH